jgi:GntP family gluconate:H+ symporter
MATAYPLIVLFAAMFVVISCIVRFKLNAFVSLILTSVLVGLATPSLPLTDVIKEVTERFGNIVGRIGIAILMAGVIGYGMTESGAADKIVRKFVTLFRRRFASLSIVASGFILSIPVFADTVFYLLIPLARSLTVRLRGRYVLNTLSIMAGASVTHSFVPPTPGPLAAAAALNVGIGPTMLIGLMTSVPVSIVGWLVSLWMDRKMNIPIREAPGPSLKELEQIAALPEEGLPRFWTAICPILLPVALITADSLCKLLIPGSAFAKGAAFLGEPNVALMLAAATALWLLTKHKKMGLGALSKSAEHAMLSTANVIFITAAGGAFGGMLHLAGVGAAMGNLAAAAGFSFVTLAFVLSAIFKIAQGSATVCMITVSSMLAPLVAASPPDYHPAFLVMAVASGALVGSWMNDSGFWVFQTMTGLTPAELLRSRTVLLAIMGLTGFLFTALITSFY